MHLAEAEGIPLGCSCEAAAFAALPTDSVLLLFSHLSLRDVCAAGSTCASWHRCLSAVWRPRCVSRWRHWSTPPPAHDADAQWRDVYARRHKTDKHVLDLLHSTCWPTQQAEAYSTIMGYGADALDVLAAAAQASTHSGLYLGMAFHAQTALLLVQAHLATQCIKQLLAAGAKAGAAADGGRSVSASAVDSTEDVLLELALQVTQALHPLSDVSAVRLIVRQLGDELTSRMKAAEVAPGSRQALDMLNALMLARPLSQWPSPTSTPAPEGPAQGSNAQQGQQGTVKRSTADWSVVWPQLDELQGPDLPSFQVSTGSGCGLGLEGNQELLGQRSSLCLDSVLRSGTGHPVVMAVLHRAVGRRAGLNIDLVGVPDNFDSTALVLTRVTLTDECSNSWRSRSSNGVRPAGHISRGGMGGAVHTEEKAQIHAVHFSVFTSQVFGEDIYRLANRSPESGTSRWPDGLPAMTPDGVCKALLSHLCVLVQQSSFLIHMDAQPPLLTALAIQLGVLQPKVLQPYVANFLVSLLSDGGMGRLYLDILKESTDLQKEELMLSSLFSPVKEPLVQRSSSRPAGQHQLGDCVWTRSPFALAEPEELSIITGWHSTGYFQVQPEWDVLMCGTQSIREPLYVRSCHPSTPASHSNSTSADSQPHDPASPTRAWWSSSDSQCLHAVRQAHQLLQEYWFEPDLQQRLAALLLSSGQETACVAECLGLFAAVPAASKHALGRYFDAVWHDVGHGQCRLVPNAHMRACYPDC